ncbi:MAG: hypothetical protein AB7P49_07015, partial [Bdellovibrionales bacterium]
MSAESSRVVNPKRLLFDCLFFTYSLGVGIYTLYLVAMSLGLAEDSFNQEFAVTHMPAIGWTTCAVGGLMLGLTYLLHRCNRTTLGDFLFACPIRKQEIASVPFFKS